jgi:hypothetical protein
MPINTTHPSYDKKLKTWTKCRDAIAGEEAVKEKGELYLPKLGGQDDDEYKSYLMRAYYYNATGRTHEAMLGTIFRIDPSITPEPADDSMLNLSARAASEIIAVGRCGLLVDAPVNGGQPYVTMYKAEDITNWQSVVVGDKEILLRVVLQETSTEPDPDDVYEMVDIIKYRELYIDEKGKYAVQLWVANAKNEYVKDGDPVYPQAAGNTLDSIPFVFVSPDNTESNIVNPPLLDLVSVNLSHYRSAADLEHGRHYTALPTAWVAGFDSEKELSIGSATAWVTDNVNAKAGFLEFTGQGLGALERALEQKEAQMAMLGTQIFASGKDETATAAKIHRSQQTASLSSIAGAISEAMSRAYQYVLLMLRSSETAVFEMSKDFMPETLDSALLTVLVSTYQQGAMSLETLLWNMKQGELLPPDITPEEEQIRITAGLERMTGGIAPQEPDSDETQ